MNRRRAWIGRAACLAMLPLAFHGAARAGQQASTADDALCLSAIRTSEQAMHLPAKLLGAIGLVESGRLNSQTGTITPWPWTINVAGIGHMFATKPDAIAAVQAAQAAGVQSIDVGCMQVNLMHHPDAFASLDQAFDPQTNTIWAAGFLTRLHAQTSDWPAAAAAYHSMTPSIAADYAERVAAFWPLAASAGARLGQASAAGRAVSRVDPYGVLTPEFRARLVRDAAYRTTRNVAMGLVPAPPRSASIILAQRHGPGARSKTTASRVILQASLRNTSDPAAR
jgi:Transglycosylase SLT domain